MALTLKTDYSARGWGLGGILLNEIIETQLTGFNLLQTDL